MDIREALFKLQQGHAIKRISQDKVYYVMRSPNFEGYAIDDLTVEEFDKGEFCGAFFGTKHFSEEDIFAEDWIVYTRPRDMTESEAAEIAKGLQKSSCAE